ncbi:MAG: hypothetical protein AAGD25_33575 [Cyanobacteria bacterium P01_F01_bin.150]
MFFAKEKGVTRSLPPQTHDDRQPQLPWDAELAKFYDTLQTLS